MTRTNYGILMTAVIFISMQLILVSSCSGGKPPIEQAAGSSEMDQRIEQAVKSEGIYLDNPEYTDEMMFRTIILDTLLTFSMGDGRLILNGGRAELDYEMLLSEGVLPIILRNRYTGQDLISTTQYSPGDIYLAMDTESGIFSYYRHMGPLDAAYEPDAVPAGEKLPWAGMEGVLTDGRSLFLDKQVPPSLMGSGDPAIARQRFNIPAGDDARVEVYLVYRSIKEIMYAAGIVIEQVPQSIDGYIDLVGRPNPVAWTNPYTGQAMQEVPWVEVPAYNSIDPREEPTPELYIIPDTNYDWQELAGNYSYALGPSRFVEGEDKAYAQFYFLQPDGSIGAYLAGGQGPLDRQLGSQAWADMASSAGWSPDQ